MFTDTHTHLYLPEFKDDREAMFKRALEKNVTRFFLPNIDAGTINPILELCNTYPAHCFPMIGLHPCSVFADFEQQLALIKEWAGKRKFYAIGEIGLDFYHDITYSAQQKEAFRIQVKWAKEMNLPVVIHCRNSFNEVLEIIKEESLNDEMLRLKGIFHCFSGSKEDAEKIMELKTFKIGIGGVVTYKNSALPQTLIDVPLSYVVLETDSPYLPPIPFRGKRNESSYICYVAEKLADIYKLPVEKIGEVTTENSAGIFGI